MLVRVLRDSDGEFSFWKSLLLFITIILLGPILVR